jgi:hypothetical protein
MTFAARSLLALVPTVLLACTPAAPATTTTLAAPAAEPCAALDALDSRRPLPLQPHMAHHQKQNMRDHLVVVQEIAAALAVSDFKAVETAAGRITTSDAMGQMCGHMGAAAPGFTPQALAFHQTADSLVTAARAQDAPRTWAALSTTLQACTACHAQWKQQIVDAERFQALADDASRPAAAHMP